MLQIPTILIIKTGTTYRDLKTTVGDFEHWIVKAFPNLPVRWKVKNIPDIEPEKLDSYQGLIITGSHNTLTQPYPYLNGFKRVMEKVNRQRIPLLGICFGHQLVHKVLGGEVTVNALGPEIGIANIQLTLEGRVDPLFRGIPGARIEVYASHTDVVTKMGEGFVNLAWNEMTQHQATRREDYLYTVQFHPEYNAHIIRYYFQKNRASILRAHLKNPLHIAPTDDVVKKIRNLANQKLIFSNFFKFVIMHDADIV